MTSNRSHKEMEEEAQVALVLRDLLEKRPHGLAVWIRRFQAARHMWQSMLPPVEKGRSGRVQKHSRFRQVSLLAAYLARPKGMKRATFLHDVAQRGKAGHFAYGTYSTRRFCSSGAVESALKAAEKIARSDPHFKAEAEWFAQKMAERRAQDADAKVEARSISLSNFFADGASLQHPPPRSKSTG